MLRSNTVQAQYENQTRTGDSSYLILSTIIYYYLISSYLILSNIIFSSYLILYYLIFSNIILSVVLSTDHNFNPSLKLICGQLLQNPQIFPFHHVSSPKANSIKNTSREMMSESPARRSRFSGLALLLHRWHSGEQYCSPCLMTWTVPIRSQNVSLMEKVCQEGAFI